MKNRAPRTTALRVDVLPWTPPIRSIALTGLFILSLPLCHAALAAQDEPPRAIFVIKPDGSGLRRVVAIDGLRWLGSPRWSHDGERLAFDANDGGQSRCLIIDASGKNLRDLGAGAMPDWSPDDKQIVFQAPQDGKASIWVQNTNGRGKIRLAAGSAGRWSPDGAKIAALAPLRILDVVEGTANPVFDAASKPGKTLACEWSPDGKRLALVVERGNQRELVIVGLDGPQPSLVTRLTGDLDASLGWSPDGEELAICLRDPKLDAYRLHLIAPHGEEAPVLIVGQQGDNRQPAFSPDGAHLAFASSRTGSFGKPLVLGQAAAKLQLVRQHDKGGTVYSVAFAPDGRTAFLGGDMSNRGMQVWDVNTGDVLRSISVPGIFVAIAPDGRRAACAEFIGGDVQYLDLDDGSMIREFAHGAQVISLRFSGDGSRLVAAGVDKNASVFDVASGEPLVRVAHDGELKAVAFSPDDKLFASVCTDKKLHLWDAATGKKVREIVHPATPWSVVFSPDGRQVMTGTGGELVGKRSDLLVRPSRDNVVRVWDVASGKLIRELKGHTNVVSGLAYSPDGKHAASASFDHSLRLWDVESGRLLSRVEGEGWFTKAIFSSDGRLVLASGGAEKNFRQNRWFEFPQERVRLYRIAQ